MTRTRVSGLEVLRGYAALAVVFFHTEALYVHLPEGALKATIGALVMAVPLFFALSAYSLLYGYSARIFNERSLLRFYTRRAFRIAPLFYVMLAVWVGLNAYQGQYTARSDIVINLAFLFPLVTGKHESLVAAGWSLGVEWMFYLAFPLFALISRNLIASMAAFAACVLVSASIAAMGGPYDLFFRQTSVLRNIMFFQAGVLAFAVIERVPRVLVVLKKYSILFISACLLAMVPWESRPYVPFAFACGILVACAHAGLPRFTDNAASRYLGRISYGLYLIHPFALLMLSKAGVFGFVTDRVANVYLAYFTGSAIAVGATVAAAALAYRLIESPGIALGERLLGGKQQSAVGASAVKNLS